MKKKICIIHKVNVLDPRSYYKEGRSLLKAGYAVTLIGLYEKDHTINGINIIGIKQPANRLEKFTISNYKIFSKAFKLKSDAYHFHDPDFIPWVVLLKFLTKSKIIYDIHEAYPEYMLIKTYIPKIFRKILYLLMYLMEHVAVKFCDAIILNDNFVSKSFKHKNKEIIFNFPLLDFFNNKNIIPNGKRKYNLFYHGSLPKYTFEVMMNVAEKLNYQGVHTKWGIVMSKSSPLNWAREEVKRRGLDRNFYFLPFVNYLEVKNYLLMAQIGIIPLPSYKKFMKNIPLKMFEFMGFGIPVVLSDLPPSRQFIQGENCAIAVEPNNVDEYARAIKTLLDSPKKATEMGQNGKVLVFKKYNWDSEEKKLFTLYKNLFN